jgi:hypothetical protein
MGSASLWELESQLVVKGMDFSEKACFAPVAGYTTKVPYTAIGSADKSVSDYVIREFHLIFGTAE